MSSTTTIPLLIDSAPVRDQVSRTYSTVRILSGFTDENHFQGLVGDYLTTLTEEIKTALKNSVEASRQAARRLTAVDLADVISRDLTGAHVTKIEGIPEFQQIIGSMKYKFAWVKPANLIAIQTYVKPRKDTVPEFEAELLDFALPSKIAVPAEVAFVQPQGPIHIVSSSPNFKGIMMKMDPSGVVTLGPPPHFNLIQVRHFGGRYYLMNGYHRVSDCIRTGRREIPAIVTEASNFQELELGYGAFSPAYFASQLRPPLVSDFAGPASIDCKLRERRFGVTVSLDIKPLNIGI